MGISSLARTLLASNGRFVIACHGISKRNYPNVPARIQPYLTIDDLRALLAWIKKHFLFLTVDEFLGSDKSGILLTFDDGLANGSTNALPVLVELETPAIFFVSTQHVVCPKDWLPATREIARKYWEQQEVVPGDIAADFYDGMSREQLAQSARSPLVTIGSHTVSHPLLTQCDSARLTFELVESRRFLQEVTRQTVDLFAYPAGDYDRRVAQAVQDAGYRGAFVEDLRNIGFPAFEIPRIGLYASSPPYLSLKLSGLHRRAINRQLVAV